MDGEWGAQGRGRGRGTLPGKTIPKKNVSGAGASGRQREEEEQRGAAGHRMSSLPLAHCLHTPDKSPFVRGVKARQVSEI